MCVFLLFLKQTPRDALEHVSREITWEIYCSFLHHGKNKSKPKCPMIGEWICKLWYIQTQQFCNRPHVHTHIHMHTRTHTCTRAHTCTKTRTRTYTQTRTHRHTRAHAHTHIHMHTHTHTCTRTHTCTHAHARTCTHRHTHAHVHTHIHTDAHTRTHVHTHAHARAHTLCICSCSHEWITYWYIKIEKLFWQKWYCLYDV